MKSLTKIVKYLLQPWNTVCRPRIGSLAKAVIVGCSVSFMLWAVGWTLFSSSSELRSADLKNRSVVSVLLSPDYRFIEGRPERWAIVGECSSMFPPSVQPQPIVSTWAPNGDTSEDNQTVCKNWVKTEKPSFLAGVSFSSSWTAVKYLYSPQWTAESEGSSRSDALDYAKDIWVNAASSLLTPLIVLLVMQMGVLVGYQYFRRSPETNISDEDIS
jgi:hypothetical protein